MAKCKRKICDIKRTFQDNWKNDYLIVPNK